MTAAGVIAMTATIMPTPLGADNVISCTNVGLQHSDLCAVSCEGLDPNLTYFSCCPLLLANVLR